MAVLFGRLSVILRDSELYGIVRGLLVARWSYAIGENIEKIS